VIDRYIPLVTAAYGTWVAQPARTTTLPRDSDGSSLGRRVRPVPVPTASLARARRARGSRVGRLELHVACSLHPRSGTVDRATCGSVEGTVSAPARCCPRFTGRLRSRHGPSGVPVPSGRGRLRRSGPPRPGTDRPAGHGKADAGGDLLHAMDGMPPRMPLLGAFAAGQGQNTTARWEPLLSPTSCPRHAPRDLPAPSTSRPLSPGSECPLRQTEVRTFPV
jgi:hypothetical protein